MKKNTVLLNIAAFISFSVCSFAQADTRYDKFCVISSEDSKTVMMYNDLIESSNYYKKVAETNLVKNVSVYTLQTGSLPAATQALAKTFTSYHLGHPKKVTSFEEYMRLNASNMQKYFYENGYEEEVVNTVETKSDVSELSIVVKNKGQIVFSVPYVVTDEDGHLAVSVVKADDLIFNGKKVSSVHYYECGYDAD